MNIIVTNHDIVFKNKHPSLFLATKETSYTNRGLGWPSSGVSFYGQIMFRGHCRATVIQGNAPFLFIVTTTLFYSCFISCHEQRVHIYLFINLLKKKKE